MLRVRSPLSDDEEGWVTEIIDCGFPALKPVHRKQALSYMKTLDLRVGLVINFNTDVYKHGVQRVIL